MMKYLANRDVDWAYWPLNPDKIVNKVMENMEWVDVPERWEDDTWGFLGSDWMKVRYPWQLNDLRGIMQSPSSWMMDDYPCDRGVVSKECGG